MDIFTKEKRSEVMSKIRGKNTKVEIMLRQALYKEGIRGYRLHKRIHKIRPDLVFIGRKIAIFIDGCFWHGCPECFKAPKSRTEYWGPKIQANMTRDIRNSYMLEQEGWTVLRFWEHEVRKKNLELVVGEIKNCLGKI